MKITSIFALFISLSLLVACGGEAPKTSTENEAPKEVTQEKPKPAPKAKPLSEEQIKKGNELIAAAKDADIAKVDGKKKFKSLCASCHGFTGDLKVNGASDLTISSVSLAESVGYMHFGSGLMTPFKGLMTEAEMVAVAKYAESLRK